MKATEFLKELEYLLQDIPEEEKRDAISYYEDYFRVAGAEQEADVISELGSPERVAAMIRAELGGSLEQGGAFTDRGFEDERFRDPRFQVAKRRELPDVWEEPSRESGGKDSDSQNGGPFRRAGETFGRAGGAFHRAGENFRQAKGRFRREMDQARREDSRGLRLLRVLVLLALLTLVSPVFLGIGGTAAGIFAGVACLLLAAVLLAGVLTVAAWIGAAAVLVLGFGMVFTRGWSGVIVLGGGIFLLGLALFCTVLSILIYGKLIPWCFRGIVDGIGRLLHRGRRTRA